MADFPIYDREGDTVTQARWDRVEWAWRLMRWLHNPFPRVRHWWRYRAFIRAQERLTNAEIALANARSDVAFRIRKLSSSQTQST